MSAPEHHTPRPASCPQAELEIQKDALEPGQKVVIVDDLLATGGECLPQVKRAWHQGAGGGGRKHLAICVCEVD